MVLLITHLTSRGGTTILCKEQGRVKASGNVRILVGVLKFTMADPAEEQVPAAVEDEEPEETPGYKAPAQKTVDEIQQLDADDESLVRYKQALLGNLPAGKLKVISSHCPINIFADPCTKTSYQDIYFLFSGADASGPNVQVLKMSVVVEGREDIELDLTGLYQNLV